MTQAEPTTSANGRGRKSTRKDGVKYEHRSFMIPESLRDDLKLFATIRKRYVRQFAEEFLSAVDEFDFLAYAETAHPAVVIRARTGCPPNRLKDGVKYVPQSLVIPAELDARLEEKTKELQEHDEAWSKREIVEVLLEHGMRSAEPAKARKSARR